MPQREIKYKKAMQDGRRKLDPKHHARIKELKKAGMSSADLALEYEVSVSLIKFIVYPNRQKAVRERNKLKWKDYSIHYGKEARALAMRKYRAKKRKLGLMCKKVF